MQDENLKSSFWDFDRLSLFSLYACLLVLPLFYLPFWGTALEFSKKLFILLFALAAAAFWLLGGLKRGSLTVPKNKIFGVFLAVLTTSFVSLSLAASFERSFVGLGFELDSWVTFGAGFVLMFLAAIYFQTKEKQWQAYFGLMIVALFLFFYHLLAVLYFNTDLLSFGVSDTKVTKVFAESLLGKWHDFGIFFGFIALSSLVVLEFFKVKKVLLKALLVFCLFISLAIIGFINYFPLWLVVGGLAFLIFGYKFYLTKKEGLYFRPGLSLVLGVVCVAGVFLGNFSMVSNSLASWRSSIGMPVFDVRPSWTSTYVVTEKVLQENSLFGNGPNSFDVAWTRYKPSSVYKSDYWNANFRFGVGLIPSMAVNLGLVGFVLWLTFLALILGYGFYALTKASDKSGGGFLLLPFVCAIYLWAFTFFSVPGNYILALSFVMTGFFVAALSEAGIVKVVEFSFLKKLSSGYAAVILFILIASLSVVGGYLVVKKYVSVFTYHKGLYDLAKTGDLAMATTVLERAQNLDHQDLYYQKNSELYILRINELLQKTGLAEEEVLANFKTLFDLAVSNAQKATEIGPENYVNWLALGKVYASVVPLNIEGAYEEAVKAFNKALELSPDNPVILLNNLARLELVYGQPNVAREYISRTLAIRPNYSPAILTLAEMESNDGQLDLAIRTMEDFYATYPESTNVDFLYQLGYLKYKNGNHSQAINTLEKVLELVPVHANARYFLGLSHDALGQTDLALENFKQIQATNPESADVAVIINNLESGRRALSGQLPE